MRVGIIGGLLALLAGCSAVRLAYDQGPFLTRWWLDGFFDFNAAQKPVVRQGVDAWFAWHRTTQLRDAAQWLTRLQQEVMDPVTPDQMCRHLVEGLVRLDTAVDRFIPLAAAWVATLEPAQFTHLEERYARSNVKYVKDFIQPSPAQRLEASTERAIDRARSIYGEVDAAQKRLLTEANQARPFEVEAWSARRIAQQRDVVAVLRQLRTEGADRERTIAALRALKSRWIPTSREAALPVEQRLMSHQCEVTARLHNTTTAAQRRHAREKLRGWELDLRHLAEHSAASPAIKP